MHQLSVLTLLIIISGFWSCSNNESSIRSVAHKYLGFRLQGDFISAEEYVTLDSHDLLSELEDLTFEFDDISEQEISYQIKKVEEKSESASVVYNIEGFGEEKLQLIMENGKWKVFLGPQSVPDAGILMMELRELEREDSSDIDKETLDRILMDEDIEDEWADSSIIH